MARWQERDRNRQRTRRRALRRAEFQELWIDLCWCAICEDHVWHVEQAPFGDARDGLLPSCPECGGMLLVVDHEGRGVRLH